MPPLRLIPGAVGPDRLQALVLAPTGEGEPSGTLTGASGGASSPLRLSPHLPWNPSARDRLAYHGLSVYTARADGLKAGQGYTLEVRNRSTSHRVAVTTLPDALPADGMTVMVATCFYDYFKADKGYLDSLRGSKWFGPPAFKILAGDNVYLDVAPDQAQQTDGYEETLDRYVRYFWQSGYADVLSHLPTFTTWDDHEFWNNYPEVQCHLDRSRKRSMRDRYIEAGDFGIAYFQVPLNPDPVVPGGRSYCFDVPPLHFFVADTRSRRTPLKSDAPVMFPEEELVALERWARGLDGPGVFVIGQPMWIEPGDFRDYTPPDYPDQYARIWRALAEAPFDILVVSGDVHHSRVLRVDAGSGRLVYEFVTSPACHVPTIGSIAMGSYRTQDEGRVKFPGRVQVDVGPGAPRPTLLGTWFGTTAQNTFGLLQFKPVAAGGVAVGCAFVDTTRGDLARTAPINGGPSGRYSTCHDGNLFTLRRRP